MTTGDKFVLIFLSHYKVLPYMMAPRAEDKQPDVV
jgi:hypothetical protein